jgi:hypothetical protein
VASDGFSIGFELSTGGDGFRNERGAGVSSFAPPSNFAAMDAVLRGRTVCCVEEETCRVGEMFRAGERALVGEEGGSGDRVIPRVFSQAGGFCDALLAMESRLTWEGVVGVSFGFKGELFGVEGRSVDGDASLTEPGLRKGDWRGLLKDRGEGL